VAVQLEQTLQCEGATTHCSDEELRAMETAADLRSTNSRCHGMLSSGPAQMRLALQQVRKLVKAGTLAASSAMPRRRVQSSCGARTMGELAAFWRTSYMLPRAQNSVTMHGGSKHTPLSRHPFLVKLPSGLRLSACLLGSSERHLGALSGPLTLFRGATADVKAYARAGLHDMWRGHKGRQGTHINMRRFGCRTDARMLTCTE